MIAQTRVETIGRCLPPESGKFCTLFCSREARDRGQQLNCAFVSEEALDGDRNSFANAKLFGDQDAWIMPAPVAFTLLIDRNLPAVPPEAQRTPANGGAG